MRCPCDEFIAAQAEMAARKVFAKGQHCRCLDCVRWRTCEEGGVIGDFHRMGMVSISKWTNPAWVEDDGRRWTKECLEETRS